MQKNSQWVVWYGTFICAMAGIFYAYEFLLRVIPGALQLELRAAFGHLSAGTFGQISALYYLAYSPMQLPVGLLIDRYGPRMILSIACLFCAIGSWFFLQTQCLWLAGIGRFLVGFGSAFGFVGMLFLGHHWLPKRYFSLMAGLVTTFAMLTITFGMVSMTAWTLSVGLMTVLSSFVVFGIGLSVFLYVFVRDAPSVKGTVLSQHAWRDFLKEVWRVLVDPTIWLIGSIGALMYTALSVCGELWGKTYLEQAHHLTSLEAAKAVSAIFLGWAVGAPIVGYFSDHTGKRIAALFAGAFLGLVSIAVVLYVPGLSWWSVSLCLFLYGVATSAEITVFVLAKELSEASLAGTVFAAVNMMVMLGGVVLQPLVGCLLDWRAPTGQPTVLDYQWALSVLPLSMLLTMGLLGWLHRRKYRR